MKNIESLSKRKLDHIELGRKAQTHANIVDDRFFYEPLLSSHHSSQDISINFLGKKFNAPLWISSMTGGAGKAEQINKNLAIACAEFGLGMGLGSCRPLLESNKYFNDFNLRPILGDERPFFANLGIAQLEELYINKAFDRVLELLESLRVDGLIIHINPLQEYAQEGGDRFRHAPIETVQAFVENTKVKTIVKEVGQGMGPSSLKALMGLDLLAIDFASFGGTNFTKIENLRAQQSKGLDKSPLENVGHSAYEMISYVNSILKNQTADYKCNQFIISGGVNTFLDGLYLRETLDAPSIYGQGYALLSRAIKGVNEIRDYIEGQINGYKIAKSYLKVRNKYE